jgi:hypothetical protein
MTPQSIDFQRDFPEAAEEEYQALLRAVKWTDGFGLMFVRCSPIEGNKIISRFSEDIYGQNIQVLSLDKDVDNHRGLKPPSNS